MPDGKSIASPPSTKTAASEPQCHPVVSTISLMDTFTLRPLDEQGGFNGRTPLTRQIVEKKRVIRHIKYTKRMFKRARQYSDMRAADNLLHAEKAQINALRNQYNYLHNVIIGKTPFHVEVRERLIQSGLAGPANKWPKSANTNRKPSKPFAA